MLHLSSRAPDPNLSFRFRVVFSLTPKFSWAALFSFLKATTSATDDSCVGYYHNAETCEGEGKGWKLERGKEKLGREEGQLSGRERRVYCNEYELKFEERRNEVDKSLHGSLP